MNERQDNSFEKLPPKRGEILRSGNGRQVPCRKLSYCSLDPVLRNGTLAELSVQTSGNSRKTLIPAHHAKSILGVLVYIDEHIEEPMPLSKLAKIARISPYYFHRLFKAYMSMAPREYIKRIRLMQSAKRLHYSQIPITEIAFEMGYENPSSFTRAFLQLGKKSPRIYRKEKQEHLLQMEVLEKSLQPEYLVRKEETVLFLRKTGDFRVTVIEGIEECRRLFKGRQRCYGMALDDPFILPRKECRFDLCIADSSSIPHSGHWGQKHLLGGKYAVFSHCGPFFTLENTFTHCFFHWHRNEKLRFTGAFCEYVNVIEADVFTERTQVYAKYYVPLID